MRSIALLPLAALAALLGGCSTEDAGSTLTVDLSGVGMVMSRETIGTATTPDQYEGSTTATARVVYRGRNELVYRWTVTMPGEISSETTVSDASIEIKSTVITANGTAPNIGSGRGSLTLEVYEKSGGISAKDSAPVAIVTSSGG